MNREELLALAERVEGADAWEQPGLLRAAFEAIHGPKPARVHGGCDVLDIWLARFNPFFSMLAVNAFESAAMTLVPEGCHWQAGIGIETEFGRRDKAYAWCSPEDCGELSIAATPALALTAASLRAHATNQEKGR